MKSLFCILVWLFNPFFSIFLINKVLINKKIKYALMAMTFGLIGYTQISTVETTDYDILRYYSSYNYFEFATFKEAMSSIVQKGDYIFYLMVYIFSKTIKNNPQIISFIMVSLIYYFYFFACAEIKRYQENKEDVELGSILFVTLFFVMNFPLISNAFRSYLAFNLFMYGLFRFYNRKNFKLIVFISIFIHWSILIFLPIFFIKKIKFVYLLLFFSITLSIISNFLLKIIANLIGYNFFTKNLLEYSQTNLDLGKTFYVYLFFLILYLITIGFVVNEKSRIISIYIISLLIVFIHSPISLFRYTLLAVNYSAILLILSGDLLKSKDILKIKNIGTITITIMYVMISMIYLIKNYIIGEYTYSFNIFYTVLQYFSKIFEYYKTI